MSTLADFIVIADNEYANKLTILNTLENAFPDGLSSVSCVTSDNVYLHTSKTYEDHRRLLHKIAKGLGKYKLKCYNLLSGQMYMRYEFNDASLVIYFYCNELETTLQAIGKGKCRITETPKVGVERSVTCDV